jgi:hypothetical protein
MRIWMLVLLAAAVPVTAAAQAKTTFTNADLNRKPAAITRVPESEWVWLRENQFDSQQEKDRRVAAAPTGESRFFVFGRPDQAMETTPWYVRTFHGAFINDGLTWFPLLMPTVPVAAQPQPIQQLSILPQPRDQR